AVRVALGAAPCGGCRVLSKRLDLRGRLSSANIHELLRGKVFENVFLEELLIESSIVERPRRAAPAEGF
ncbi:MAG TPA: hypothetical protein VKG05_01000, partial [Steroidobacteraceae bacterium]|nr:hypothetical protein [Steroidobacteraceae bacterium]